MGIYYYLVFITTWYSETQLCVTCRHNQHISKLSQDIILECWQLCFCILTLEGKVVSGVLQEPNVLPIVAQVSAILVQE